MRRYQANGLLLRGSLLTNAAFSAACAAIAIIDSGALSKQLFSRDAIWLGLPAQWTLLALGVALGAFASLVALIASRKLISRPLAIGIVAADLIWVLSSIGLLVAGSAFLTAAGKLTIEIVGLAVLTFSIAQSIGLTLLYQGESEIFMSRTGRSRRVRLTRHAPVPSSVAWEIMVDHEAYVEVAENLSRVEVLEGDAKGMRRKCTDQNGDTWTEVAHVWDEGKRYGFKINTDAPDYPYPLEALAATWTVEPKGADACDVSIEFDVTPRRTFKGAVFIRISMVMFPKVLHRLLGKWKARMEARHAAR